MRFSDAELSALKQSAANAGCSMSELVINYAGKIKIKNRQDERERTIVLNRLNANLNM
ncbi:plasmid mobilization protein, partial [Salmonella enterica]